MQLSSLLDNAQALLADSVPISLMNQQATSTIKNGVATGTTPAVYSCLAMQVIHQNQTSMIYRRFSCRSRVGLNYSFTLSK